MASCRGWRWCWWARIPASQVYVRNKAKQTSEVGMASFEHKLAKETGQAELLALVERLNADPTVNGILVQLPLPKQIDPQAVLDAIDPAKDVDGFHVVNAGKLATGGKALVPCTPLGCLMLLKDRLGDLSGKRAVVVGRSNIVGKPMAQLLLGESCTVTIAHSRTRDLPGRMPPGRDPDRRRRQAGDDPRRLDPAGRHGDRCRHQPHRAGRQDEAGGRCGL